MRGWRAFWIGAVTFLVPPVGLVLGAASWRVVAVFAALTFGESLWLAILTPDSAAALGVLLLGSLVVRIVAVALALSARSRWRGRLPWWRRWYALPLWVAALVAVLPDTWLGMGYDVYIVPSGSMEPTLRINERFFARLPDSLPLPYRRGDVVVFRTGPGEGVEYVKRVVALPGDRVQMQGGVLQVNGRPVAREALGPYPGRPTHTVWRETLPDGATHETLDSIGDGMLDSTEAWSVPEGHLFVMGDNRDDSLDSRVMGQVGFVPMARVTARARFIIWGPDWGRIGTRLD